jgi:uncharacterized protein
MKNRLLFSATLAAVILLIHAIDAPAAQRLISFMSPPAGGGAYVFVAGTINVSNKYMPEDAKFIHEATTGTMEMVRRLMLAFGQKKEAFADFGTPDAWNAYKGEAEYKGKPFRDLRAIVFNQNTDVYLVVPANSPIKSYADVKGKRIGMGGAGSSPANCGHLLLDYYGVHKKDFKPYYYVYKESIEGLGDGSLDGAFFAGGYPMASYMELSTTKNVRIVPVDESIAKKIIAEHPGHYTTLVKAKSYRGIEQDTLIMGWTGALWTHSLTNPDLVYTFIKNLFDHKEEYFQIHQETRVLSLENATKGIFVPFHPGAEKYLREVGAIK